CPRSTPPRGAPSPGAVPPPWLSGGCGPVWLPLLPDVLHHHLFKAVHLTQQFIAGSRPFRFVRLPAAAGVVAADAGRHAVLAGIPGQGPAELLLDPGLACLQPVEGLRCQFRLVAEEQVELEPPELTHQMKHEVMPADSTAVLQVLRTRQVATAAHKALVPQPACSIGRAMPVPRTL